jgi:thiol-disulfide isomerase/thioredoxin
VVVVAAAVLAGALITVVVAAWTSSGGGNSGVSYVDGSTSAVLYAPGHRQPAPEFTATTLTGSRLSLSAYRGKVVLVNFWGSWCPPCRAEAPVLADLSARYRAAGVAFLGVDVRDTAVSAAAFERRFGITYPSVSDTGSAVTLDFTGKVPITGTPTTLVIDRTGHIAGAVFGEANYTELTTILSKVTGKAVR